MQTFLIVSWGRCSHLVILYQLLHCYPTEPMFTSKTLPIPGLSSRSRAFLPAKILYFPLTMCAHGWVRAHMHPTHACTHLHAHTHSCAPDFLSPSFLFISELASKRSYHITFLPLNGYMNKYNSQQ